MLNFMEERGTVLAVEGGMARVRIERREPDGCGCGTILCTREVITAARNTCGAAAGDRVWLRTNHDARQYRITLQGAAALGLCLAGAALGEYVFSRMGLGSARLFSVLAGVLLGGAFYLVMELRYRKNPLPPPELVRLTEAAEGEPVHAKKRM